MPEPVGSAAPLRVVMVCAGGLSSSLVETHLRRAAESRGIALDLRSMSVFVLEHLDFGAIPPLTAILVAPQVRFMRRGLERRVSGLGIAVLAVEPMDFGMADGEAILNKLLAAVEAS
jgi:PTS system cellobiose-specific IIB component